MKKSHAGRRNARFSVLWHVLYGTDDFIGNGTLLDLSALGCRLAGTMPVEPGMHLRLRLYPQQKDGEVRIEEAHVTWVNGNEFGVELKQLSPRDHHWLLRYTERAERRSTFHSAPTPLTDVELSLTPLSLPIAD